MPLLSKLLANIPIRNDPKKLIKRVPKGKQGKYNLVKFDIKYRRTAPIEPPLAT